MTIDHNWFLAINGLAGHSAILDRLGIFFADPFLYLSVILVALFWLNKKYRYYVYIAAASVVIGRRILAEIIKHLVHRPRPFQVLNVHQLLVDNEAGNSFPSGHAIVYFALAFSFYGTKWFWPMVILAAIGSTARVFVGVHYPLDVLAGAALGGLVVWVLRSLFKKPQLR